MQIDMGHKRKEKKTATMTMTSLSHVNLLASKEHKRIVSSFSQNFFTCRSQLVVSSLLNHSIRIQPLLLPTFHTLVLDQLMILNMQAGERRFEKMASLSNNEKPAVFSWLTIRAACFSTFQNRKPLIRRSPVTVLLCVLIVMETSRADQLWNQQLRRFLLMRQPTPSVGRRDHQTAGFCFPSPLFRIYLRLKPKETVVKSIVGRKVKEKGWSFLYGDE